MIAAERDEAGQELQRAFIERVGGLLPAAYRLAYGMLHDASEAEDTVQEALFKAWRAYARLRDGSNVRGWFMTIVANQCRHQRRGRWWTVLKRGEMPDGAVSDSGLPFEDAAELRRSLALLPHDYRLAIVLRYYLDLPLKEVSQVLGISVPATKSRIHRAVGRLRLELDEEVGR